MLRHISKNIPPEFVQNLFVHPQMPEKDLFCKSILEISTLILCTLPVLKLMVREN